MAVYTKVPRDALDALLKNYDLGGVTGFEEILQGSENSNYFVTTERCRMVLSLYEKRVKEADLPFFLGLMRHAAGKGMPCPSPVADKNGQVLHSLCGRPATLASFLEGAMTPGITPAHCRQLGEALARLHRALDDFAMTRANDLSVAGWQRLASLCAPRADEVAPGLAALIKEELDYLSPRWPEEAALPRGVIHGDLFPDNVFFKNGKLCGLIDFYFACTDHLAYDLAICANAWCFEDEKNFSPARMAALVEGYESLRPLNAEEKEAWPLLLRGAALRFLLTRLYDFLNTPRDALVKTKDPLEYRGKLVFFRGAPAERFAA